MDELFERFFLEGCEVRKNESMACHTSMKVGGPVKYLVLPNHMYGFERVVKELESTQVPYKIMGLGTNLLVQDGYMDVVVVKTERLTSFEVDGRRVTVESGIALKRLCEICAELGLSGLEFAYGIPGSVGGAVFMNAGAYGREIGEFVESVEVMKEGRTYVVSKSEASFSYRSSVFKHENMIIKRVTFLLKAGERERIRREMREHLLKRLEKQPLDLPSAGSVFKRPRPDFYVGKALEELGLKGFRVGGAQISEKHAGFIVNVGGARFEDVISLIEIAKRKVREVFGVELETEIEIWKNDL